jgi:large subunit ribosomal protein L32
MAHPKHRHSKQRTRTRRTHHKAETPQIATCSKTGEKHMYHRTYFDADGNMLYRGKVVVKAPEIEG